MVGHELRDLSSSFDQLQLGLHSFRNKIEDQDSRDIVSWLSRTSYWSYQTDVLNRRQEGTGSWIFEDDEFQRWAGGTVKTLVCSGIPGAGKTVLASIIIDYLECVSRQSDVGVAYIYCNYKDQDQSPENFAASLLQQLVEQRGIVSEDIRSAYQKYTSKKSRPTQAEYLKWLGAEIACFSKLMVVVDALDECPESNGARNFLLHGLQRLDSRVHLLVTSRHIPSIQHGFESAGHLEVRAHDEDLEKYLKSRIEKHPLLARLMKTDQGLHHEILDNVIKKAHKM